MPPPCDVHSNPGCAAIEEHGKVAVARLPFVQGLVGDYGAENITISALSYNYIKNDAYIDRLLGKRFGTIDCIIPVSWPAGDLVYLEIMTKNQTKYLPLSTEEFEDIISHASEKDRTTLFTNMNTEQAFVRLALENPQLTDEELLGTRPE